MLDLLAIGAHPDDVEMSSGGWMCLAAQQGYKTGVLHLTRGEMGTHGTPETREAEARNAAKVMGCEVIEFAGLKDGFVNDDFESIRTVADWVRQLQPRVVLAPFFRCHHPDHEATARLANKGVHYAGLKGFKTNYEAHRINRLVHARYSYEFQPSFYVDVSSVIEQKREAILSYASQFKTAMKEDGKPLTRMSKDGFVDQFLAQNAAFGLKCGARYAEAYHVGTPSLVDDPIAMFANGPDQHLIR